MSACRVCGKAAQWRLRTGIDRGFIKLSNDNTAICKTLGIAVEARATYELSRDSANQVVEHLAANIGQLSVAARMQVAEPFVIEAHQVQ